MTKLSVNINKIATLRNARGNNNPDVVKTAMDCEKFGADGITVHPRPDQRHIRPDDVTALKSVLTTELNIEGNPTKEFMQLVLSVCPTQVTLVPDSPEQLTSNTGWDTKKNLNFLTDVVAEFKSQGIRTSVFIDANPLMVQYAAQTGVDRIELYTEPFASLYAEDCERAINPFIVAANEALSLGLEINAGHDLSLVNLGFLHERIPQISEVSIGHALVCDALYLGLERTIAEYKNCLKT